MKKTTSFIFGLALALSIFSCSKDDENSLMTAEEATINAKMDIASDDVADIVEEQESSTYLNSVDGKTEQLSPSTLSDCATVTRVPAFGTAITPGTTVTKTIDFGTVGCVLANGNVVKGKIIISFVFQPDATTHTINYTFDEFYHNAIQFVGTKLFTRTMTVGTDTNPSHPVVTMDMDMTATFPSGNSYTRVGQRVREIVEGYSTAAIGDNIYRVTGSWTTSFPDSSIRTSTITSPLMVKMSCIAANKPLLVKGVITITRNDNTSTLDYGDGTCDNFAIFTFNGTSYTIVIGN
jgi:hypothetical protein